MKKSKQLFSLDIDGTLLDSKYQKNTNLLNPLIERLQQEGYIFSLNSNRSLEDLLSVSKLFGIQGPLIGENGAFIYINNKYTYLLDNKQQEYIKKILPEIKSSLINFLKNQYSPDVFWQDEDTVDFLSNEKTIGYPENSIVILNNKF